ncbi:MULTISPECIES: hypothetical protein [Xenorhabdus]|nr:MULTISPECIES: hypothetical protein [Xenorhabdus]
MSSQTMPYQAIFASRQEALNTMLDDTSNYMMVDSFKGAPVNMRVFESFNPFHVWPSPSIPVPGQPKRLAQSVESVWQGVKLVDGITDFNQFLGQPTKRPEDHERRQLKNYCYADSLFVYGDRLLDLLSARFLIYLPTYLFILEKLVPEALLRELNQHLTSVGPVLFYDWDANQNITDTSSSFSHSALLASWFNGTFENDYWTLAHRVLQENDWLTFDASIKNLLNRYYAIHNGFQDASRRQGSKSLGT